MKAIKEPYNRGCLGIKSMIGLNKTLQRKWLWKSMKERDSFSRRVIRAKFGTDSNRWYTRTSSRSPSVSLWRKIGIGRDEFQDEIAWEVKARQDVRFWLEEWMEGGVLRQQFPKIYSFACNKKATTTRSFSN